MNLVAIKLIVVEYNPQKEEDIQQMLEIHHANRANALKMEWKMYVLWRKGPACRLDFHW